MAEHYSAQRLRRGIAHFLWGKASSALLSFVGFLLVARLLQTSEYGRYVAMVALVELALNLASFGLDWVSTRYVPEYRVRAGGRRLAGFVLRLTGLQVLLISGVGATLWVFAAPIASLVGVEGAGPVLRLYAAYLVLEGASRVLRDQMLSQLLLQGRAQVALVLRHITWVGACGVLFLIDGEASLLLVAKIELCAAGVGLVAAALGLARALRSAACEESRAEYADWVAPVLREMWMLAANSYLSFLLNIPARPQVLTLLVTRFAGVEGAALYGFARSLADQVLRFLPAEMLLSLIRPVLIARYVASGDFQALNRQTNHLLILSLVVLCPVLAVALGKGELLVGIVGAGKFNESGLLLALMLLALSFFSHRRMLEFLANTIGLPQAIGQASLFLPLIPVFVGGGFLLGWPMWFVPLVGIFAELAFGCFVIWRLKCLGFPCLLPLGVYVKLVLVLMASSSVVYMIPLGGLPAVVLVAAFLAACIVVLMLVKMFGIDALKQFLLVGRE